MPLLVLAIIVLNYIPFVIWNIEHGSQLAANIVLVIIFHILLGLLVCSWIYTSCTDPGVPPERWQRAQHAPDTRVCRKSGLYKPPRSHYCSITGRLTLNMDHFCPWVVNTVGATTALRSVA